MKPTKMAALLLAGMSIVGMTYATAGQRAFAHNFSEDESATFLVDIWAAKVHLMLVGKNLANTDAALAHIDHVHMIIDDEMLNEIAERNERIAEDIPAALDDLAFMIESREDRNIMIGQFRDISNLLAEAVSVRIDTDHIKDAHIQALVVAGLADNALASYEQAHGLGVHMMEDGHMMEDDHAIEGDMEQSGIVDHDAYVAAKAFATLAKNTFLREKLVNEGSEKAHDAQSGLVELRKVLYAGHPLEDVTVLVHIGIHEKLQHAFGLEIAGHTASDGSEDDHMDEGSMEEGNHMDG